MLDRYHNSNGNHGADLVAYLYNELDEHSRDAFEVHLAACVECAIELAAVSDARLGVIEWRRSDFDHLATPQIVVPDATPVRYVSESEKTGAFTGVFQTIFSLPLFARTGIVLASVAILAGLVYFTASLRTPTVADGNIPPSSVREPDRQYDPGSRVLDEDKQAVVSAKSDNSKSDAPNSLTRANSSMKSSGRRTIARNHTSNVGGQHLAKRVNSDAPSKNITRVPRLNTFDDDEDKTLRLADLFAEIGKRGY